MSWILLLIQALPTLIQIVKAIWEWTRQLDREKRDAYRKRVRDLVRTHHKDPEELERQLLVLRHDVKVACEARG